MKFTIQKSDVLPVLAKIQGLAGRRTNLAITTNILIQTKESRLLITATDLETGFEGFYPATIESQGTIAINARKFYEIVRDFPSDEIVLNEVENYWIEIKNHNVEYHIVGMNPDDFPEIPKIEAIEFVKIDSATLAKMIEKTVIISGASDDKRAHIIGIYAHSVETEDQNIFRLVSTDGSRLSKADCLFDKEIELPLKDGILIPKKGLSEVQKFLDAEGTVQIGFKDNNFIIKKENETLVIRLLEGDFPQYEDIIRKGEGYNIQLDKHLFLMMLRRMSILSSEDYKGVIFNFDNQTLLITSTNPDIGESKEDMEINYTGEPISVMFNPKFFIDALSVIDDDKISLNILNKEKPCQIEAENDKTYLSVIMPMKI